MDEQVLYPVCPYRNVPAAFARFHGKDSGGIARFFSDDHLSFLDGLAAVAPSIWLTARLCGGRLAQAWNRCTTPAQLPLLPRQPMAALRAGFLARDALAHVARFALQLRESSRARLAHARHLWAAHPQLPLFLGPQPVALALLST